MKQIIKDEIQRNLIEDNELSQESISTFAEELLQCGMITRVAAKKETMNAIITCFFSDLDNLDEYIEIEDHYEIFLSMFEQLDGLFVADKLKRNIKKRAACK